MKCPNCASDVPDNSNFCGVCGFDVRAARAAAAVDPGETIAIDDSGQAEEIRAQIEAATAGKAEESEPEGAETMHDSAPETPLPTNDIDPGATVVEVPRIDEEDGSSDTQDAGTTEKEEAPETKQAKVPKKPLAPSPAIQSTSIDLQVTSTGSGSSGQGAPHETFASMPAIEPPAGGKFRETQWFMAAQDPDHIDNIGNVVLGDLEQQYKPQDSQLDTQVRQKFSLNVDSGGAPSHDVSGAASSGGGSKKGIAIAVVVLIAAAIAGYVMYGPK